MNEIVAAIVAVAATDKTAITKLIETFQSGVGALSSPLVHLFRTHTEGRAALVRDKLAHALKMQRLRNKAELTALKASLAGPPGDEIVVTWEPDTPEESAAAQTMLTEQQEKRRANLVTIAAEAADHLPPEASEEPVDPDWVARFFSYAQDVSTEQLQALWGRILANEVAQPGKVPLRTLDVLRSISRSEAEAFRRFCRLAGTNRMYFRDSGLVSDTEITALMDAGLVDHNFVTIRWAPSTKDLGAPGEATVQYVGGHSLHLAVKQQFTALMAVRISPSGVPIARLMREAPSRDELELLAAGLNRVQGLTARVLAAEPGDS